MPISSRPGPRVQRILLSPRHARGVNALGVVSVKHSEYRSDRKILALLTRILGNVEMASVIRYSVFASTCPCPGGGIHGVELEKEEGAFQGVWGAAGQGLTLVHFSAQLKPCLTHTKHPTHPKHPLTLPQHGLHNPLRTPPIPYKALTLSWTVDECKPLPRAGFGGGGGVSCCCCCCCCGCTWPAFLRCVPPGHSPPTRACWIVLATS